MLRAVLTAFIVFATTACQAQLTPSPRAVQQVSNPSMVIDDRGTRLEVLPSVRATMTATTTGTGSALRMVAANTASPFTPSSLGVVFNHAMQTQGVTTGEVTFKMKGNLQATAQDFPPSEYPGLSKLTNPNVFVVVARTPSEYVAVYNRLKARADIDWVEAIVDYSAPIGTK